MPMASAVETLIFDLDDTLIVEEALAEAAFVETGAMAQGRYGLDPRDLHRTVRNTCRELWYAFPSHPYCKRIGISSWEGMWAEFIGPDPELKPLREWAPEYRAASWRTALQIHGIDDPVLAVEMAEAFPRLRRQKHEVFPDTLQTLDQLLPGYRMGLLTNGAADLQRRKIAGAKIGRYFDVVLISGETGIAKPDRRAFDLMLSRLGSCPERAIMIGDRLSTDVQGAQASGIRAVWVNRARKAPEGPVTPEWEISNLGELCPLLTGLSK